VYQYRNHKDFFRLNNLRPYYLQTIICYAAIPTAAQVDCQPTGRASFSVFHVERIQDYIY
ncbi:hypothetical protein M1717_26590, partial [Salmonella enterica subsp. enterica serovar Pomona]|uniref:hypothetical protein n=1 Tax=Salmonella enterica TaxID=28901 RepID=UPI0021B29AC7|nr:hypothetical protein [Salmonella enterica subsp. enterica serovar Pomona]